MFFIWNLCNFICTLSKIHTTIQNVARVPAPNKRTLKRKTLSFDHTLRYKMIILLTILRA
jgi:hypothetical protein